MKTSGKVFKSLKPKSQTRIISEVTNISNKIHDNDKIDSKHSEINNKECVTVNGEEVNNKNLSKKIRLHKSSEQVHQNKLEKKNIGSRKRIQKNRKECPKRKSELHLYNNTNEAMQFENLHDYISARVGFTSTKEIQAFDSKLQQKSDEAKVELFQGSGEKEKPMKSISHEKGRELDRLKSRSKRTTEKSFKKTHLKQPSKFESFSTTKLAKEKPSKDSALFTTSQNLLRGSNSSIWKVNDSLLKCFHQTPYSISQKIAQKKKGIDGNYGNSVDSITSKSSSHNNQSTDKRLKTRTILEKGKPVISVQENNYKYFLIGDSSSMEAGKLKGQNKKEISEFRKEKINSDETYNSLADIKPSTKIQREIHKLRNSEIRKRLNIKSARKGKRNANRKNEANLRQPASETSNKSSGDSVETNTNVSSCFCQGSKKNSCTETTKLWKLVKSTPNSSTVLQELVILENLFLKMSNLERFITEEKKRNSSDVDTTIEEKYFLRRKLKSEIISHVKKWLAMDMDAC